MKYVHVDGENFSEIVLGSDDSGHDIPLPFVDGVDLQALEAEKVSLEKKDQAFKFLKMIYDEFIRASGIHPPMASPHEGYAIINEEVDEFWDEIKKNNLSDARKEIVQVGAMCLRFLVDCQEKK